MVRANKAINLMTGISDSVKKTASSLKQDVGRGMTNKHLPWYYGALNQAGQRSAVRGGIEKATKKGDGYQFQMGHISKARVAGALGAGYVATDTAYRALSGGSMYRNSDGERDFVGVPIL